MPLLNRQQTLAHHLPTEIFPSAGCGDEGVFSLRRRASGTAQHNGSLGDHRHSESLFSTSADMSKADSCEYSYSFALPPKALMPDTDLRLSPPKNSLTVGARCHHLEFVPLDMTILVSCV